MFLVGMFEFGRVHDGVVWADDREDDSSDGRDAERGAQSGKDGVLLELAGKSLAYWILDTGVLVGGTTNLGGEGILKQFQELAPRIIPLYQSS